MLRSVGISNLYPRLEVDLAQIEAIFHALDDYPHLKIPEGELSIVLMSEEKITHLHEAFLQDPTPTDVITFPEDPMHDSAGEICVSVDEALEKSQELGISLEQELTLYLVHGWLHLAGLEDKTSAGRQAMRQAESNLLDYLTQRSLLPKLKIID